MNPESTFAFRVLRPLSDRERYPDEPVTAPLEA